MQAFWSKEKVVITVRRQSRPALTESERPEKRNQAEANSQLSLEFVRQLSEWTQTSHGHWPTRRTRSTMRSYLEGSPGRTYASRSTGLCKPYLFSASLPGNGINTPSGH